MRSAAHPVGPEARRHSRRSQTSWRTTSPRTRVHERRRVLAPAPTRDDASSRSARVREAYEAGSIPGRRRWPDWRGCPRVDAPRTDRSGGHARAGRVDGTTSVGVRSATITGSLRTTRSAARGPLSWRAAVVGGIGRRQRHLEPRLSPAIAHDGTGIGSAHDRTWGRTTYGVHVGRSSDFGWWGLVLLTALYGKGAEKNSRLPTRPANERSTPLLAISRIGNQ